MTAYYNEHDPFAAQWLRNLIAEGHIAPGHVDERDIRDIRPADLDGFVQCHFFAGIGVWSYALRRAGWPDGRPVWTASCPCQPFSAAGRGEGFADERHLWPAFFHLLRVRRPGRAFGEQVASKDGLAWLDLVHDDLEGEDYTCRATDTCAAGFGPPHIRQRLWWVADDGCERRHDPQDARANRSGSGAMQSRRQGKPGLFESERIRATDIVADAPGGRSGSGLRDLRPTEHRLAKLADDRAGGFVGDVSRPGSSFRQLDAVGRTRRWNEGRAVEQPGRSLGRLVDSDRGREGSIGRLSGRTAAEREGDVSRSVADTDNRGQQRRGLQIRPRRPDASPAVEHGSGEALRPGPLNSYWRDADWLCCRDGRWRPVEPGSFPLAHGIAGRVGRLRAYGNAIVAEAAQAFIETIMDLDDCVRF